MKLTDLRTPCVIVNKSRVERNLDRMQAAATARNLRLRPHAKTHKSTTLARLQIDRGAVGICCAKLGEAEIFADAGIEDIRLPYPINPVNADRVQRLLDRTRLSFIVDDLEVAKGWSNAMHDSGREVGVLVKVDVGFHRCGIDPENDAAAEIVARVAELPGLKFLGLLSHAGQAYNATSESEAAAIAASEARILTTLSADVQQLGAPVSEISVGATPTARYSVQQEGITEIRPGNYIYYDRTQVALRSATWDECALTVLARVVSRPAEDRVILDSGSKTLTNDQARGFTPSPGYGAVFSDIEAAQPDESLLVERLSEEHANVRVLSGTCTLKAGDLVRVLPNHSCTVSNLMDAVWLVDGEGNADVIEELKISARGRIT